METGLVQLDANTVAPAIVIRSLSESKVLLFVLLESGNIQFNATRGAELSEGIFLSDAG